MKHSTKAASVEVKLLRIEKECQEECTLKVKLLYWIFKYIIKGVHLEEKLNYSIYQAIHCLYYVLCIMALTADALGEKKHQDNK